MFQGLKSIEIFQISEFLKELEVFSFFGLEAKNLDGHIKGGQKRHPFCSSSYDFQDMGSDYILIFDYK